ncbi:MAG: thioredoxin [Eubacteriales bacterium]
MAGQEKTFTTANFETDVLKAEQPVLVDFWATWCGPCRMIAPTVEELAEEYAGRAIIGKVDVDENPELAKTYGVMSIPTLILFKDGKVVNQNVGLATKRALTKLIEDHL